MVVCVCVCVCAIHTPHDPHVNKDTFLVLLLVIQNVYTSPPPHCLLNHSVMSHCILECGFMSEIRIGWAVLVVLVSWVLVRLLGRLCLASGRSPCVATCVVQKYVLAS